MPRLKSTNFAVTQLAANMTATDKTFTVTDASKFPNSGPFTILVYNTTGSTLVREIMEVQSIDKTTNTFSNVLRGMEGTTAAAHSAGDNVELVWTAGTYQRLAGEERIHKLDLTVQLKAEEPVSFSGTLTVNGWTGTSAPFIQTVTVVGISAIGSMPMVDVKPSADWNTAVSEREAWSHIKKVDYSDDTLTFYADVKPTIPLSFRGVQIVRQERIQDKWTTGAIADNTTSKLTSQLFNGRIYCPASSGTDIWIYDIEADAWTKGSDAPSSMYVTTSHLYNDRIFCTVNNALFIYMYDIPTNTWIRQASAPVATDRRTSQLYKAKIYYPQNSGTALLIYDITTDTWSYGANAPSSVGRSTSVLYNGKIYCPASRAKAMEVYDIATNTWEVKAPAPSSAERLASVLYNGKIYCPQAGGTALHIYDIATDTWTVGAPMPSAISFYGTTPQLYKGKIYLANSGGAELFIYDIASNTWTVGAVAPSTARRDTSQVYNGKIYFPESGGGAMYIYG